MGDILMRAIGEPVLPIHCNVTKFRRGSNGQYVDAEDWSEIVKRRQMVNAKERQRVSGKERLILYSYCGAVSVPHMLHRQLQDNGYKTVFIDTYS